MCFEIKLFYIYIIYIFYTTVLYNNIETKLNTKHEMKLSIAGNEIFLFVSLLDIVSRLSRKFIIGQRLIVPNSPNATGNQDWHQRCVKD